MNTSQSLLSLLRSQESKHMFLNQWIWHLNCAIKSIGLFNAFWKYWWKNLSLITNLSFSFQAYLLKPIFSLFQSNRFVFFYVMFLGWVWRLGTITVYLLILLFVASLVIYFSSLVLAWKTENQKYEDYTWMREHRLGTFQRVQVTCREVWFVLCLWASSRWDLEMRSLQICWQEKVEVSRNEHKQPFLPYPEHSWGNKVWWFFFLLIHTEGMIYHFAVENYTYVC